jgi:hypothetical protein
MIMVVTSLRLAGVVFEVPLIAISLPASGLVCPRQSRRTRCPGLHDQRQHVALTRRQHRRGSIRPWPVKVRPISA